MEIILREVCLKKKKRKLLLLLEDGVLTDCNDENIERKFSKECFVEVEKLPIQFSSMTKKFSWLSTVEQQCQDVKSRKRNQMQRRWYYFIEIILTH